MIKSNILFKRITATLLGILIIVYIAYQIYAAGVKGISTQTALYSQINDTIDINAWVVREESVITNTKPGVLSYNVSDGQRVTKNSSIANLYTDQDIIDNRLMIDKLEDEIKSLELLKNSAYVSGVSQNEIAGQISTSLTNMLIANQNQNYDSALKAKNDLHYYINQKALIVGEENTDVFEDKISELKKETNRLQSVTGQAVSSVSCQKSGYFLSYLDGYENSFDFDNIENTTVSEINDIKKYKVDENAIGKVTTSFNWYVVAIIDEQQKIKLEDISTVNLDIASASGGKVPATIEAMNYDSESGNYALVLRCSYSNSQLLSLRNETIQLVIKTYSGVLVNEKNIKFEDVVTSTTDENGVVTETVHENVKGVYVKYGEILNFVQVFSDITVDGYAVCKTSLNEDEKKLLVTKNTVSIYDEIVTEKVNVYDGKIVK